jgi:protein O-GlcNAc transferase
MSDEHPAACISRAALTAELLTGAERSFLAGNLVMAGWLCEEILQVEPDDPGALHLLGLIAERERRLTDASILWRQALASHPYYTPAWLSLATLHRSTGNRQAAILCYRCLLAVDPADRDG